MSAPVPGGGAEGTRVLALEGVTAGYDDLAAVHEVTLHVAPGEIVALVGSNGAGKTTLLRALSGVIAASGRIVFEGRELSGMTPDERFALGLVQVPEGRQLFERMSVQDTLRMGAFRRHDKAAVARDLARVHALFPRLAERRAQWAGSLSGGEQQMCALARALMAAPRLMMIDEMSLGLAPVVVDQLIDFLSAIRADGVAILLVEQDIELALSVADRGYVMQLGRIVLEGAAAQLLGDAAVQQAYFGLQVERGGA